MNRKTISGLMPTLLLIGILAFAFNIHLIKAQEDDLISILDTLGFTNIAESTDETFPPGTYEVTLYAEFSGWNASNELSWYIIGTTSYNLLFSGPEGNFGYTSPPITKSFTADFWFGLSLLSPQDRYFTETARNPDTTKHAKIYSNQDNPAMFLIGFEDKPDEGDADYQDMVISLELVTPPVDATIDIDPNTLNLYSKGRWITVYIELPENYNVSDINASTVKLNGKIPAESHPTEIGDHDTDGIPDLMVKFDRQELIATLGSGEISITITGFANGILFEGNHTIRTKSPSAKPNWHQLKAQTSLPLYYFACHIPLP